MQLLMTLVHLLIRSGAELIRSQSRVYRSCQEVGQRGNTRVYTAASSDLYDAQPDCKTGSSVILKCPIQGKDSLIEWEFQTLQRIQGLSFIPVLLDFANDPDSPLRKCIVMEKLAVSIQDVRDGFPPGLKLDWVTLGSIGARSVEIMTAFHKDLGLIHTDPHPGNWMLEPTSDGSLSPRLKIIDFGECTSYADPFPVNQICHRLEDIQQIVMSLRYLYDGDFSFFAYKRLEDNKRPLVCENVPRAYCDVFQYIDRLSEIGSVDYDLVHNYMVQLITENGGQYNGEIIWNPTVSALGAPDVKRPTPHDPSFSERSDPPGQGSSFPGGISQLSSDSKLSVRAGSNSSSKVTISSATVLLFLFFGVF